jgi:hypothetical protein
MLMRNCGVEDVVGVSPPSAMAPEALSSKVTSREINIFQDLGQKHL